jgi:hypothetical protein
MPDRTNALATRSLIPESMSAAPLSCSPVLMALCTDPTETSENGDARPSPAPCSAEAARPGSAAAPRAAMGGEDPLRTAARFASTDASICDIDAKS